MEAQVESVERIGPGKELPLVDTVLAQLRPELEEMGDEAPEWVKYKVAAEIMLSTFIDSMPGGFRLGSHVTCAGVRVSSSDGRTTYEIERRVGGDPAATRNRVFKYVNGAQDLQGRITGPGRMNGPYGWTKDRNAIVAALASYTHNFVAMLLAYFRRGSLPLTQAVVLPNLVLRETRVPPQFHPALSLTFNHIRPSLVNTYIITTSSTTPAVLGLDWWTPAKDDLARLELKLPEGTVRSIVALRGPPFAKRSGFFTVNVLDAPNGITIESITTTPRTV